MNHIFDQITGLLEAGECGTLVVVTSVSGHTPQIVGAKMIVKQNGTLIGTVGGGRFEHVIIEKALRVQETGTPESLSLRLKAELGMCCGGEMEVYMEPLRPSERLICFGAGHVAEHTVALASNCAFQTVVVDERSDWNSSARFPRAKERYVGSHGDFLHDFTFRASDMVVIMTHNHDYDRDILARVLRLHEGYVGMIGSIRKVEKSFKQLRLEGFSSDNLARVHAPIGLDILAVSPAEIGVSVVGELIRHRHKVTSQKMTHGAFVESLNQPRATKAVRPRDHGVGSQEGVDVA
jgi:xanthine dehydrogenase accessory factor